MKSQEHLLLLLMLMCFGINAQGQTNFEVNKDVTWDYGVFMLNPYYAFQFKNIPSGYVIYCEVGSEPTSSSLTNGNSDNINITTAVATGVTYDIYAKVFSGSAFNASNLVQSYHWHYENISGGSAQNCYYELWSGSGSGGGGEKPAKPSVSITNHLEDVYVDSGNGNAINGLNNYVVFTCGTTGAKVYYTTDGTNPKNSTTRREYSGEAEVPSAIDLNNGNYNAFTSVTIKSVSYKDGEYSDVDEHTFTKASQTPSTSMDGNNLRISFPNFCYSAFKRNDGSVKDQWRLEKGNSFTVQTISSTTVVNYIEAYSGFLLSNIYTYYGSGSGGDKPAKPSASLTNHLEDEYIDSNNGGTINGLNNYLSFTSTTEGATIYYTTDNSDPRSSGSRSQYNGSPVVPSVMDFNGSNYQYTSSVNVKAVAFKDGQFSDVYEHTFTKASDTPTQSLNGDKLTITVPGGSWIVHKRNDKYDGKWRRRVGNEITFEELTSSTIVDYAEATPNKMLGNVITYNHGAGGGESRPDDWKPNWSLGTMPRYDYLNNSNNIPGDSKVKATCQELWGNSGNDFNGRNITRTVTGLENGQYKVTLDFAAISQYATADNISGCGFYCNNQNIGVSGVGFLCNYYWTDDDNHGHDGTMRTGTVEFYVNVTDGKIEYKIDFANPNFNWFLFNNFKYEKQGNQNGVFIHYQGRASEMTNPPAGLKTDFKTHDDDPRIAEGATIQRAHEYTHDVYVMPGGKITLEPFSDFHERPEYHDVYQRWYNYKTDMTTSRLTVNGATVYKDANDVERGFFGGSAFNQDRIVGTTAEYTAPNSNDDIFDVIAVDVANETTDYRISTNPLTEPTLSFRHIFVVHNAKKLAEDMTGSSDKNKDYINAHRIKLTCPEGTPFQYRLDNYEYRGWHGNDKPTGYYYKSGSDSYSPVYHYRIELRKINNGGMGSDIVGSTAGNYSYDSDGKKIGNYLNKQVMSHPIHSEEETVCNNMQDNLVYTYKCTQGYDRMLYWKKPTVGNYKIIIYALDATNPDADTYKDISIYNDPYSPVVLMEYELEVLPKSKASLVDENTLKYDSNYSHQSSQFLHDLYGKPTAEVNFDNITTDECNMDSNGRDGYYKWPWIWEMSSYSFNYDKSLDGWISDYNIYMVANKSSQVPYKNNGDIYDRLYADTNGAKQGFFFYCNAASDPSRMAVLNIGNTLCQGTRVFVSAWINEFNNWPETANVVFAFKGVKADGTEELVGSYVTGYVPGACNAPNGFHNLDCGAGATYTNGTSDYRNKWMHVYFCFTPSANTGTSSYDHYIISLENNCSSSFGADYAIDDIQAFVCRPELQATQENPVCNGDPATKLILRTDFDQLFDAFPIYSSWHEYYGDVDASLYYTFINKDKYESMIKADGSNYMEAYLASVVRGAYSNGDDKLYGELTFNLGFDKNILRSELPAEKKETTTSCEQIGQARYLYFPSNSNANTTKITYNTKYWCIMNWMDPTSQSGTVAEAMAYHVFDVRDKCSAKSEFEVIFRGVVKIDGVLHSEQDGINICTNQRPKITIDVNDITEGGVTQTSEEATFDWYYGPSTEVSGYDKWLKNESYEGVELYEAMTQFRLKYPSATQDDFLDKAKCPAVGAYTDAMYDCIKHFIDEGMIELFKPCGFVSSARYGQILGEDEERRYYITAVPWDPNPGKTTLYCLEPIQVTLKADTRHPSMMDGNDQHITYPEGVRDVPLRIGLRQLKAFCNYKYIDPDEIGAAPQTPSYLLLPLRQVKPITEGIVQLGLADDKLIYLADSDDPRVNQLYRNEKGKIVSKSGAKIVNTFDNKNDVKFIGEVLEIKADTKNLGSVCRLAFYEDFEFREGYYYTIKFMFKEKPHEGFTGELESMCPGEVICTIKVVPEYQKWTGAVDSNWNNDKNWSRVSYEELKYQNLPDDVKEDLIDYVTNGPIEDIEDLEGNTYTYSNNRTSSFVPADFTKVIIPANVPQPIMYDLRQETNLIANVNYAGTPVSCNSIKSMTPPTTPTIGDATENINFDMSSFVITEDNAQTDKSGTKINVGDVSCISWYDHTCEQIHFESRAEMVNQQYLNYEKASADFEIEPDRWYTMASPLQNVVAGDMYLPTATARQETPYFYDIHYDVNKNDRFKPAVYQRKWNAQNATIYHLDKSRGANDQVYTTNAAEGISLDWSHVYNDANEDFGSGVGFSIKADVSSMDGDKPEMVMFRLPKADTQYTYYSPGNTDGDAKTEAVPSSMLTNSARTGRLVEGFTVKPAGNYSQSSKTKYFLVGNPFMCTIDMAEFFKANDDKLQHKFWLLTKDGQRAAVMDENYDVISTSTEEDEFTYPYIKPFQSFFVEMKEEPVTGTASFTPVFNADMMHVSSPNDQKNPNEQGFVAPGGNEGAKTRSAENPSGIMRITATDSRGLRSAMVITDGAIRHTSGAETLFDSNLANEPMVYSVIDGQAMTIGEMKTGQTIPIGLAGINGEATITISGIDSFESQVCVIDAQTGETTPLTSDIALNQTGDGVRYYIATDISNGHNNTEPFAAPVVTTDHRCITIKAPAASSLSNINIVTSAGTAVFRHAEQCESVTTEVVTSGVYVISLTCDGKDYSSKIAMR